MSIIILEDCKGFDWNVANQHKNKEKHEVSSAECEEVFFNKPLLLQEDLKHSQIEQQFYVLGKTDKDRKLFIAFTIRKQRIRIISARDMSKKERKLYEQD